ncbi:MAG: DUF3828 domain-containing protein [Pseudomonadota bacterium]
MSDGANAANIDETAPDTSQDEAAIRAFLDPVFASYKSDTPAGFALGSGDVLEPELAARVEALKQGQIGFGSVTHTILSYDPICKCQDWSETAHAITLVSVEGDTAIARVAFTNTGREDTRAIDLVRTPKGWRVYDLDKSYRKEAFED